MSGTQRKPGFWDRLIGREAAEPPMPAADPAASRSEGTPATGADPAPAQATQASPETPADEKLPPELSGADLQPVEGVAPQGAAPKEPVPRPEPGASEAAGPKSWWRRLSDGMRRTSSSIGESVTGL